MSLQAVDTGSIWKNPGKDIVNTSNTRNYSIKKVLLIFITPKLNLEVSLITPMLVTSWHKNYKWHFFKLFHGNQLQHHLLLSRTQYDKKICAWSNHKKSQKQKLTHIKKIILQYFVWINIIFPLPSFFTRCYMTCKNYMSSRSRACTTGHFSAEELTLN